MNETLYTELAPWWPLLAPPIAYTREAELHVGLFQCALGRDPTSMLELGSGTGMLATHYSDALDLELVDLAEPMLAVSREYNPDRVHHCADMRTLDLGRTFDTVLLHDAVMYLLTEEDLRATFARAFAHLDPGGAFLIVPDVVEEDFEEGIVAGGNSDEDGRGAQMLEWHWDPDPTDGTFRVDFTFLLRDPDGTVRNLHDPHTMGLHPRERFGRLLREVGFELVEPDPVLAAECGELFLARKPA